MASLQNLSALDNFANLRNGLSRVADGLGHWAGIPMPLDEQDLVIEPRFPGAQELMVITKPEAPPQEDESNARLRNIFWCAARRRTVYVYDDLAAKVVRCATSSHTHHLNQDIKTLGASVAWGIEQEHHALQLLGTMLPHHTFKNYLLTGMFLERSARSDVTYLFRRLKPTVAISTRGAEPKVLCALCLHPIAYYAQSWAGAMCPTDDVVAHLVLMRGDEHLFWKRANQHSYDRPEAGL